MSGYRLQSVALLLFVVFALLLRFTASNPIAAPDTGGYTVLARAIEQGSLDEYSFARTPGLPMLMLLVQYNHKILITIQYIIAILSIIMLYNMAATSLSKPHLALLCCGFYVLNLNIWSLSSTALTDSLSASLTLIAVAFMYKSVTNGKKAKYVMCSAISITIAILVRPILLTIFIAYIIVHIVTTKPLARYYIALVAPLVIAVPWVYIVWANTGKIGLTTLMPKNITNHTGAFLEYASDEYSAMRDPYIEERDSRGTHVMTIFRAQNAMRANYPELTDTEYNDKLMRMSLSAIGNRPFLYIRSVLNAIARNHIPCNPSDEFLAQLGDGFLLRLWARRGSKLLLMLFELLTYLYLGIRMLRREMKTPDWFFASILLFFIVPVSMLESPSGRYMMPIIFIYYIYGCKFLYEYVVLRFTKQR